jgi:hypothetical protein
LVLFAVGLSIALSTARHRTRPPVVVSGSTLDPGAAFRTAESLVTIGRFVEAVPFYRRSTEDGGARIWIYHAGLAWVLRNCSIRRVRSDFEAPALRSSYERVSAAREALVEIHTAAGLGRPYEQSAIAQIEGEILEDWGLPLEALTVYRKAQTLDTTGECAQHAATLIALLRSPVAARTGEAIPGDPAGP